MLYEMLDFNDMEDQDTYLEDRKVRNASLNFDTGDRRSAKLHTVSSA